MTNWGGKRQGAGRPKGSFKLESNRRSTHSLAAFDDEWELIHAFANAVKHGDKDKCIKFVKSLD